MPNSAFKVLNEKKAPNTLPVNKVKASDIENAQRCADLVKKINADKKLRRERKLHAAKLTEGKMDAVLNDRLLS